MLRRLPQPALHRLIEAGYGDAVLAEPLLDAKSPGPALRSYAMGVKFDVFHQRSSLYQGAHAAYLKLYAPNIDVLDSPADALVEKYTSYHVVRVEADHLAWLRLFNFRGLTVLSRCTLGDVLRFAHYWSTSRFHALRLAWAVHRDQLAIWYRPIINVAGDIVEDQDNDDYGELRYESPTLLADVRALGPEPFAGMRYESTPAAWELFDL